MPVANIPQCIAVFIITTTAIHCFRNVLHNLGCLYRLWDCKISAFSTNNHNKWRWWVWTVALLQADSNSQSFGFISICQVCFHQMIWVNIHNGYAMTAALLLYCQFRYKICRASDNKHFLLAHFKLQQQMLIIQSNKQIQFNSIKQFLPLPDTTSASIRQRKAIWRITKHIYYDSKICNILSISLRNFNNASPKITIINIQFILHTVQPNNTEAIK